ncbi:MULTISPECIES: TrkH family potassium uptake protein [Clostridia]|uniref:TrkH family potassium uptake protein n=1 Tax=Clostridia TaxID=186801 RepID=UPI000EA06C06|nr:MULTISPECIES: TrkH family potassium uptake protein [Clostridia]NBJ67932.1 Ktr system potassium transporter B [Roseburia sp. 1XD42-34]RKI82379.1 Ktr system potassium transporter B [Clostridium sp. 1xD42-85]
MKKIISLHPLRGIIIHCNPPQILAITFLFLILIGTLLLKVPAATYEPISWLDAWFTATSAITVTGLVVVDTGSTYTLFGEIVIMFLMQIGGLGLMTFSVLILMMMRKKVGLRQRLLTQESLNLNQTSLGGLLRLVKLLFIFSITIEAIAFLCLSIKWVPEFGWSDGLNQSLFHSISAFNNAGFSLWSDSLSHYVGDPLVNIVITGLFIIGGLGFTVLVDIWDKKGFQKLSLHSKLMLSGTLVINIIALFALFFLEYGNPETIGDLSFVDKLWGSYFQAVTPRTAGFNSLDIAEMTVPSILLMMLLMFIGAGSGSTGSGIKVTSFVVMLLATASFLRGKSETTAFKRTIKLHIVIRALSIMIISISLIFLAIFILTITERAPFLSIAFEVISAFGTVGISMGLTGDLTTIGKIVIMIMMFIGRIGPLTMVFVFAKRRQSSIRYPEEDVFTG